MADDKIEIERLTRQIAELRTEVDTQRESKEFAQRCCEKAKVENARLRALPLKDEVERVLEEGRKNAVAVMKALMTTGSRDNLLLADAVHRTDDAARSLLSRLRAGEQEGWRSMDSAPKDGRLWLAWNPEDWTYGEGRIVDGGWIACGTFYDAKRTPPYRYGEAKVEPVFWMPLLDHLILLAKSVEDRR